MAVTNWALSKIVKETGCQRPCIYNEYKFVNLNKKESNYKTFPDDQVSVCLWPVSPYTQVEEDVLVLPFQSLLAEFGGALGLFLGFSFMTIWDGVMEVLPVLRKIKKSFK